MTRYGCIILIGFMLLMASCSTTQNKAQNKANHTITAPSVQADKPVDLPGVHNVVAYTETLLSGGWPESSQGLKTLKAMGIKTIIDVDGAKPDVERARELGMRYVHLPFGYDGVPRERQLEIARAVRDLEKPIYLHCHHGKHRSAAGLASVCVTLGLLTQEQALAKMHVSGTAPNYKGLFASVAQATFADKAQLDQMPDTFPSTWQTENIVDAMVAIDAAADHLKSIQKAGWKVPASHPDLVPAAEAGQLADLLRNLKDDPSVIKQPKELTRWLLDASTLATDLETQLTTDSTNVQKLDGQFKFIMQSCKHCHSQYRD